MRHRAFIACLLLAALATACVGITYFDPPVEETPWPKARAVDVTRERGFEAELWVYGLHIDGRQRVWWDVDGSNDATVTINGSELLPGAGLFLDDVFTLDEGTQERILLGRLDVVVKGLGCGRHVFRLRMANGFNEELKLVYELNVEEEGRGMVLTDYVGVSGDYPITITWDY